MTPRYDLHSHSNLSDGTLAPAVLVGEAQAAGVEVLALTDHDVTDGLAEAQAAAGPLGLRIIAGVEISATWNEQTVHIVGLNIDPANVPLQDGLAALRAYRTERAVEIGRRLAKHRIPGVYEGAARLASGPIVSRTHFARYLISIGYANSMAQAFKRYLSRGTPGHVPSRWAPLAEAVGWIRAAGGVAVLAHPARYRLSSGKLRKLLADFRDGGGQAIEVVCGSHSADETQHLAALAREYGFAASLGSDYHGPEASGPGWGGFGRLAPLPGDLTSVWSLW